MSERKNKKINFLIKEIKFFIIYIEKLLLNFFI